MTRNDYLQELDKHLKKLPQQDYREAMDYFTEYFDEAGPENETQVIQELGSPKEAAKEIIHNILDGKSDHSEKNSKSRLALIWIAILACLFNPFGWALIAIIFSLLVVGVAMIFTLFMLGIAGAISGIAIFIDGLSYLGSTWGWWTDWYRHRPGLCRPCLSLRFGDYRGFSLDWSRNCCYRSLGQ